MDVVTIDGVVRVPTQLITDTIITAVEQGIYYWCSRSAVGSLNWLRASFVERDTGTTFALTAEDWPRVVALMAAKAPRHYPTMIDEQGDAETADVLVQLACFGEIKYG